MLRTALDLVDRDGVAGLSMRRLGDTLNRDLCAEDLIQAQNRRLPRAESTAGLAAAGLTTSASG